jgi:hypothetical protein
LSLKFLELVKSQSEYFTNEFKAMLEKITDYFEPSQIMTNRINISSSSAVDGILRNQINSNITIIRIGTDFRVSKIDENRLKILKEMKIFE